MNPSPAQPLDIVTACRLKDLPVLKLTAQNLPKFVPFKKLHVFTARQNFQRFTNELGSDVALIDEDAFIPGLTLAQLRMLPEPGFPQGAGWYLQQLLKFGFAFSGPEDDHYLIWDADTVPLQPLKFFDDQGRMLFTKAEEFHAPYFETYKNLLRLEPHREFSFISQHIIVRKSILREMLHRIENNFPGPENWAWKIMRHLTGSGTNRFSEYEMLGHYVKNVHPHAGVFRELPWLRKGVPLRGASAANLERLSEKYAFVALEANRGKLRETAGRIRKLFS